MNDAESAPPKVASRQNDQLIHLAYAEASIMLIECLFQALIARGALNTTDVLSTLEDVILTKRTDVEQGEHPEISQLAAGVLSTMMSSLQAGFPRDPTHNRL